MCITPTKASDISEILQKKRNMDTCFIRLRENIMNFTADFKFKIVLRMKKLTNYPSPFFFYFADSDIGRVAVSYYRKFWF